MSPPAGVDDRLPVSVRSGSDSQAVACALLFRGTSPRGNHMHVTHIIPSHKPFLKRCWPSTSHPQTSQESDIIHGYVVCALLLLDLP